jgi:hypothetical protein
LMELALRLVKGHLWVERPTARATLGCRHPSKSRCVKLDRLWKEPIVETAVPESQGLIPSLPAPQIVPHRYVAGR